MTGQPSSADVAAAKISELRAVIREGNQLLGDLKRERKACEELFKTLIPEKVNAVLTHEVEADLASFFEAQQGARDEAVARITKSFDELADTLINGTKTEQRKGNVSIPELVEKRVEGENAKKTDGYPYS